MERVERWVPYSGVLALVLWIVGIVVTQSTGVPDEGAPDTEYLIHYESNATTVLTGGWIYMLGWLAFLVFAVVLRDRLAAAEGGRRFFTTVAFLGAAAVGGWVALFFGLPLWTLVTTFLLVRGARAAPA